MTIQASRIDRPDRSTLHGQLSGTGSLLIAASVFPAVTLAVAFAFAPVWWAADIWAGVCVAIQAGFVGLMLWGPLTVIRPPNYQAARRAEGRAAQELRNRASFLRPLRGSAQ